MRHLKGILAIVLCTSILAYADGNSFTRVRYNGGSVPSKVDPKEWDNTLTVTSDAITLVLHDKQRVDIPPKSVTSLSYGQEAHRRVGTMIALAVLVAPVALFGLFHKTRLHYIGIQYKTPDGKNAGILLQGDKSNYRAMLVALQGVTGVPVSVAEKERQFVPVGVTTNVTKDTEQSTPPSQAAAENALPADAVATVNLTTTPDGADVYVDGQFSGNSPATLKLKPGKHTIRVSMSGYKDWTRDLSIDAGSSVHLAAALEKTAP
ncbi:MAG TPA: PEGA domain-containing protein [Terriglobales bacterium]|nr:PEGA domain-containing protein [Terriglobales bacterium]